MMERIAVEKEGHWRQGERSATTTSAAPARGAPPPLRRLLALLAILLFLAALTVFLAYLDVSQRYRDRIFPAEEVEPRPVALVLGAGIYPNGQLTGVLADRMRTAIELYESGKVDKLLLSGDNRFPEYNEPARMADFARAAGVPESALAYDYAGRRTYDSCYRAKHVFGQEQVIVVTQAFHLPRALYLCQQMGIDAVGVPADRRSYRYAPWFALRETFARLRAWYDTHLRAPGVVGGPPIDIFAPNYNGRVE